VAHPRDRLITLYGRKPVLEALEDRSVKIVKVFVAKGSRGGIIDQIRALADERGIDVRVESAELVSRISKKPKQDQGVAADVSAPSIEPLQEFAANPPAKSRLLALDGVTTPANVGLVLRSATVLGIGVVLPRKGSPEIGPLVIKASAGVALRARVLHCADMIEGLRMLREAGFTRIGLSDGRGGPLSELRIPDRAVFVLGNESEGIQHVQQIDAWATIPMATRGDSLNVACAATIVAYEAARR
jgi:23S rRNA (guanosine2251-2'-O)-methyltransferase